MINSVFILFIHVNKNKKNISLSHNFVIIPTGIDIDSLFPLLYCLIFDTLFLLITRHPNKRKTSFRKSANVIKYKKNPNE
jgi:hypothetical protein